MLSRPSLGGGAESLNVLSALLESRTGQQIAASRQWRIETALKPVLRECEVESLDALVGALLRDPTLSDRVVDALLNQESSFFRDGAVFETIGEAAAAMRASAPGRRLRVWSAGCSTGQEPLSLAMMLPAELADISASDVSEAPLIRARSGRYSQFEIQRGLPVKQMMTWFEPDGGDWVARPELARRIAYRRFNLVADPLPAGRFDIVLCRNVLLYLSPVLRRQVFDRLATVVRPGGLLALGAGETVIGQTEAWRPSPTYRGLYELAVTVDPMLVAE